MDSSESREDPDSQMISVVLENSEDASELYPLPPNEESMDSVAVEKYPNLGDANEAEEAIQEQKGDFNKDPEGMREYPDLGNDEAVVSEGEAVVSKGEPCETKEGGEENAQPDAPDGSSSSGKKDPTITKMITKRVKDTTAESDATRVAAIGISSGAGTAAGASAGAIIGTALWPGVGTVAGSLTGSVVGSFLGRKTGMAAVPKKEEGIGRYSSLRNKIKENREKYGHSYGSKLRDIQDFQWFGSKKMVVDESTEVEVELGNLDEYFQKKMEEGVDAAVIEKELLNLNEVAHMRTKYDEEPEIFKVVVEKKLSRLRKMLKKIDPSVKNSHKQTPLHYGVVMGHFKICCLLIGGGFPIDERDVLGNTALHYAAFLGKRSIVGILRDLGADLSVKNKEKLTALDLTRNERVKKALLYYQNDEVGVIDEKNPIQEGDDKMDTLLHKKVRENDFEAVQALLREGVDPNCVNANGDTPLHLACLECGEMMLKLLVMYNSFINAKNSNGKTPLHIACEAKNDMLVYHLLDYMAVPTIEDSEGNNAADLASTKKAKWLLDKWRKDVEGEIGGEKKRIVGEYVLGKKIGEGGFAEVRIGTHIKTKEKFAIKIVERKEMSKTEVERLYKEVFIMSLLKNKHIVHFEDHFESKNRIYIVMELCKGIDMFDFVMDYSPLGEEHVQSTIRDIVDGMCYADLFGIVHRDLKPENIIVDPDTLEIKIIDFGLSSVAKQDIFHTTCGSPHYVAPEVIEGKAYGSEVDVWAIGVIMYVLLFELFPFDEEQVDVVRENDLTEFLDFDPDSERSDEATDLISKMLVRDPAKRITYQDIRSHPWIDLPPVMPLDIPKVTQVKRQFVDQLMVLDFDEEFIRKSIENRLVNPCTQIYQLLVQEDRKKRKVTTIETVLADDKSVGKIMQKRTEDELREIQNRSIESKMTSTKELLQVRRVNSDEDIQEGISIVDAEEAERKKQSRGTLKERMRNRRNTLKKKSDDLRLKFKTKDM